MVAAADQPMVDADASLDLFDVGAGSLGSAAAASGRAPDGSKMLTLYSSHGGVFTAFHARLITEAIARVARRRLESRSPRLR